MPTHINIKKKKKAQTDNWGKKKSIATIATVSIEQTKRHGSHCSYTHSRFIYIFFAKLQFH